MPAMDLKSSPARCDAEPVPNDAIVILPGLALACAISSATVVAGTEGCATMIMGKLTTPATGAMSRWMSNGKLTNRLALTTDERPCHSNVYPSGGELTTACTAMLVEAPGRFSMTTGCPRRLVSHGSMMRATVSAPPPAGKPMIQRSGFDG